MATVAVTLAISCLIVAGAGISVIQIMKGTDLNMNRAEVIRQVSNLGRWFSRDTLTAKYIMAGDNPETEDNELATLYWKDWETGDTYNISYIWADDDDSLKKLLRKEEIEGESPDTITTLVARSVYSAEISSNNATWTLTVETRSGGKASVQEYTSTQRLGH